MKRLLPVLLILLPGCLDGGTPADEPPTEPGWTRFASCPVTGPLQTPGDCLRSEEAPHREAPPQGWYCAQSFPRDPSDMWLYTDGNGRFGIRYTIDPLPEGIVMGSAFIEADGQRELVTIRVRPHGFILFNGTYGDTGKWGTDSWLLFQSEGSPSFLAEPSDVRVLEFEGSAWYTWVFRNETGTEHYLSRMNRFGSHWSPSNVNISGTDFNVSIRPQLIEGSSLDEYRVSRPLDWPCEGLPPAPGGPSLSPRAAAYA